MNERCSNCNWEFDEDGNCNCRPEDYIPVGTSVLMYINAYAITRHFGGKEEGGWWYNHQEPLASIPIRALSKEGHEQYCERCNNAKNNVLQDDGTPYTYCKWGYHLEAEDSSKLDELKKYLTEIYSDVNEGDIYSVLGGTLVEITVEDHIGEAYPISKPQYE